MNDEFMINKNVMVGSEGNSQTLYWLYLEKLGTEVPEMSFEEIKRLSVFLNKYIEIEEKGGNR